MSEQPIVFEEWPLRDGRHGRLGVARLAMPRALNALSMDMIEQLGPQLARWSADDAIKAVWLEGEGDKAFCAGGDVIALYRDMTEPRSSSEESYGERFFRKEYELDYQIHTFPKPVICWGHGIVMGGGMGLMAGASHRVVTEGSRLAMPEVGIGLYPDVGAGWFLNRMPGRSGIFLGLTGAHMNAADALFVGLADRFIRHQDKAAVAQALQEADWSVEPAHITVSQVLRRAERESQPALPESPVREHFDTLQSLTDADTVTDVVASIRAYTGDSRWLGKAAAALSSASPTSMAIIWRHLQVSRTASLAEVLNSERGLSVQCLRKGEFAEGIRALLIDKDQQPRWRYPSLEEMDPAWIDDFFAGQPDATTG